MKEPTNREFSDHPTTKFNEISRVITPFWHLRKNRGIGTRVKTIPCCWKNGDSVETFWVLSYKIEGTFYMRDELSFTTVGLVLFLQLLPEAQQLPWALIMGKNVFRVTSSIIESVVTYVVHFLAAVLEVLYPYAHRNIF